MWCLCIVILELTTLSYLAGFWNVKVVLEVTLPVAVIVKHFYQGEVLPHTSIANVFHLGGTDILVAVHILLHVLGGYNSYISLWLRVVVF